ncbi:hypothetical protein BDR04DRAFT_1129522 [Suillus decipiens]|nr:hypothetical protein BDR04DRAFT_1129522 [Suillus decipiens]
MENGWHCSLIKICLPKEKITSIHHCSLTDFIRSVFEDSIVSTFHLTPFHQQWETSEGCNLNVYSKAYSSPAFIEAYEEINVLPQDPGDDLEQVITSLMMWSDGTHLASFRDASLWPFYLCFGNQSKYTQGKPTASACHQVAYIPNIYHYDRFFDEASSSDIYTHCKHELMQAIWALLLDKEDGITQHVFPCFFTYSADYPEKILLACIKFLGECPCPCCLIKKEDVPKMGMKTDLKNHQATQFEKACKLLFQHGIGINGQCIKKILQAESLVPTQKRLLRCQTMKTGSCWVQYETG